MDGDMSAWKAGTARVEITPDESMWLAGWAARREPAAGTATPLFAKGFALQYGDEMPVLIITMDLLSVTRDIATSVSQQLREVTGIDRDHVLFNASHTHTGPEVRPDKVPFFEIPEEYAAKIPGYVEKLKQQLVDIASRALASVVPVRLVFGASSATFAKNRRSEGGAVDHSVPVIAAYAEGHQPVAVVFGYACHCLTLSWQFVQYCSEYAGFAQQEIERRFAGANALFISGAAADLNPFPPGEIQVAEKHGMELADAVTTALNDPSELTGPLRVAYREVQLDFEPMPSRETLEQNALSEDKPLRAKARWLIKELDAGREFPYSYPCPVQVISFVEKLLLIALGGEPLAQFALDFKAEYAPAAVWVAGYSNDVFGYLPTQAVLREGGYEAGRATLWSAFPTPFTDTAEPRVKDAVRAMVQLIKEGQATHV